MSKKKYKKDLNEPEIVKDLLSNYRNTGITFSSIENQGDILLRNNLKKSPDELLIMMNILNAYAFKTKESEKINFKNAHIIFSSYDYIP